MLAIIKIVNGVKKIIPLTADIGAGNPVGSLTAMYKKSAPSGYLYCDGSTFDETVYPALYQYLGTNVLPDYREFALVGAEENTTSSNIATHDTFTQGEEKDDQLQGHHHKLNIRSQIGDNSGTYNVARGAYNQGITGNDTGSMSDGRSGNVTRGKRKAVFFYIKATSGLPENQQDNVLATINDNNSYSTTEHATGKKTTDGKDIYSRTFIYRNVTLSTTGTTLENNFPISFINVTKYEGYACRNSSPLSFPVQPYISGTSLVCIQSISSSAVDKVEITIEYTKD